MKHANGLLRVMHAALMPGPMYGPEGIRVAPRRAAKAGGLPWQAAVAAAVVAGMAITNLLIGEAELFHLMIRFRRSFGKLIAQDIRIAALSGTAR